MSMETSSLSNVVAQRNTSVKKNMKKNFVSNKKTSVFVSNHGRNVTAVMISEPAGLSKGQPLNDNFKPT